MGRILIFGGSFDPIHNGHIKIARRVMKNLHIDMVYFELAASPRWKTPNVSSKDRLNMLKLAIDGIKGFAIDTYELDSNKEINYSIDTVRYFKNKFPHDEIYFLIGYDQLNKLHDWYKIDELANLAHLVAYNRKDNQVLNKDNIDKYHVQIVEGPYYNVSSTMIRDFKSIDVSKNVLRYILDNRLYYASKVQSYLSIHRYNHSVEVALLALEIAKNNKLNKLNTFKAALLHDIGKDIDINIAKTIMEEHFKDYLNMPKFSYHQFIGSYLAKHDFNVKSKEVLEAIKYHATGKANMGKIGKVVYAADKIEPTRGFDSSSLISACINDYEVGFIEVLKSNKEYLLAHNADINNELTLQCMTQYLDKND